MSSSAKIGLGILVVVLALWGIWSYKAVQTRSELPQEEPTPTLTTGSSNEDLETDMSTIDAQLQAVSDSSVEIDQSMNEAPGK